MRNQAGSRRGWAASMAEDARHVYGPRPLGAVLPTVTRPALRRRGALAAILIADWEAIVGPRLADLTRPCRLVGGTLTLACSGPVALELQHQATLLTERINTQAGRALVQRLRFVHEEARRPARAPVPVAPRPAAPRVVVTGLPCGPLHDALQALGQRIAERATPGPPGDQASPAGTRRPA